MRQLGIDVETCPRCGGKMKVIALVREPEGIAVRARRRVREAPRSLPLDWATKLDQD
jgi:hypothetical protein